MSDSSRRQFLIATAGVTTAALAGCTGNGDDDDDDAGNGNGGAGGIAIDPGTEVELDGFASHWEGIAPSSIEGDENPTLQLEAGEEYTFTWTNADGALHDFQIWDDGGSLVDDLVTEEINTEDESASLTFTASEEMAEYVCSFHASTQIGSLVVE